MIRVLSLLAALAMAPAAALGLQTASAAPSVPILGSWLTADGTGVVTLQPCGGAICGVVEGLTGFQPDGAPPVDVNGQSRCHLTIIPDLVASDPGFWSGHITNPDDGKMYAIRISLDPQGKMRMRGYIGIPLLGRTTVWTRYQGRLTPDCHIVRG